MARNRLHLTLPLLLAVNCQTCDWCWLHTTPGGFVVQQRHGNPPTILGAVTENWADAVARHQSRFRVMEDT
ncbi:hypothetical protein J4Q44_G00278850 [Coregonus suidteri]|uniref:Secreted protein n=1 Tax=Coregonus suidteri TaxID=861788 RepID=A0AAN8KZH4_9TELE